MPPKLASLIAFTLTLPGGLCLSQPAHAATSYRLTDLGSLTHGTSSAASGINDLGQVVGTAWSNGEPTAFFWDPQAGMQSLAGLSGASGPAQAYGLNNVGQVVGESWDASGSRPVIWVSPTTTAAALEGISASNVSAQARSINDSGTVSVTRYDDAGVPYAYSWTVWSGARPLGIMGRGETGGVNASGLIAGVDLASLNGSSAIVWNAGGPVAVQLGSGWATDVDDAGRTSGYLVGDDASHPLFQAVRWNPCDTSCFPADALTLLGDLPGAHALHGRSFGSQALGLNEYGAIVGTSDVSTGNHAFVWTQDSGMLDLNKLIAADDPLKSRAVLVSALSINGEGQIVGIADVGGTTHAFLASPVPEPGSPGLLATGSLLLATLRRAITVTG